MGHQDTLNDTDAVTLDDLFPIGQIRLNEISVCNWGSFSDIHNVVIDPLGTFITGDTGAGKSTLIDGVMALLQPAGRASFNVAAAQGEKKDRSLISYMRGSYGTDHDGAGTKVKSIREGAVLTGLRAMYKADDGSIVTLAALFWTTKSTQSLSDVERIYVVANRDLELSELINNFKDGNQRALKQWLKDDPAITSCDKNFAEYQALYQKSLYIENKNAPALLGRALGLKKIDNLTTIIRDLVLEPSMVRDDVKEVLTEFDDLVRSHQKLVDARDQKRHLMPLIEISETLNNAKQQLEIFEEQRTWLPSYISHQCVNLLNVQLKGIAKEIGEHDIKMGQLSQQATDMEGIVEGRHAEYIKAGGGRIEALKKEVQTASDTLTRTTIKARQYQNDVGGLSLPDTLDEQIFVDNQSKVEAGLFSHTAQRDKHLDHFSTLGGQVTAEQEVVNDLDDEIKDIEKRPNSNIDVKYQKLRDLMVTELSLNADECMFIGELMAVNDKEQEWQGAIERALGMQRLTLAVPSQTYSQVTSWLNQHYTGLYVRVQVVNVNSRQSATFKEDGFLRKLEWRKHPYRDWAKKYLAHYDLHCVSTTDELNKTLYSMTRQGLVHLGEGSFEKKDTYEIDDRRHWYLGFSNTSRLTLLQHDLKLKQAALAAREAELVVARGVVDADQKKETLWHKLGDYNWDEINAPYWDNQLNTLRQEQKNLNNVSGDLATAQSLWEEAKLSLEGLQNQKEEGGAQSGRLTSRQESAQVQLKECEEGVIGEVPAIVSAQLNELVTPLMESDLTKIAQLIVGYNGTIEKTLATQQSAKSLSEGKAIRIMASFRANDKWSALTVEWNASIDAIPDYLDYLNEIDSNGLPDLEARFKARLNKHTTQSLAKIKQRLDSERDDIIDRIETITNVLKRTEFMAGTSLRLSTRAEKYSHVSEFNKDIAKTLSLAVSDDHEQRYQQLSIVMKTLRTASDTATYSNLENLRLLDPRYQMEFIAEEVDIETDEVRDVWVSSTGKSGGEKESFAGAIVAASLAYVLTPDGYDKPIYSTVFLDEAFSNTSEVVSKRILKIFKELDLHVNLLTPYKNLNLAKDSARSLLIVERDAKSHNSQFSEITWEKARVLMEQNKAKTTKEKAQDLEIEVE